LALETQHRSMFQGDLHAFSLLVET
jgi:hypothetical protein